MLPSISTPDSFWTSLPHWAWWLVIIGIVLTVLGMALKTLLETYENFSKLFGRLGQNIYSHGVVRRNGSAMTLLQDEMARVLLYVQRMETNLEMINAYLVSDAHWHASIEIYLAEILVDIPEPHMPYSEFSRRWRAGWRPNVK